MIIAFLVGTMVANGIGIIAVRQANKNRDAIIEYSVNEILREQNRLDRKEMGERLLEEVKKAGEGELDGDV